MRLFIETLLPCHADRAWSQVRTSRLLQEVAAPLISIQPLPGAQLPEHWEADSTTSCHMFLGGRIPLGIHSIVLERVDPVAREIQSRESGVLVKRWDHLVRIEHVSETTCRYSDELEIEAGWLTPAIWLFAAGFYRHRQRKWRAVAKRLAWVGLSA